jgi:hypothetical protein
MGRRSAGSIPILGDCHQRRSTFAYAYDLPLVVYRGRSLSDIGAILKRLGEALRIKAAAGKVKSWSPP